MTLARPITSIISWTPRASGLGNIIPAKGEMTDKVRTELLTQYISAREEISLNISSKYFEKGTTCEQQAIDLLNRNIFPKRFITSYKVELHNEWVKGTPDIVEGDYVIDIKNAYDVYSFQKAKLSHEYKWQLKAYLWLSGRKKGFIFYSLIDMPDHLLADEERRLFYSGKYISTESQDYLEAISELHKRYTYSNKPDVERFKIFPVTLTEKDVETIKTWVEKGRTYINKLHHAHLENALKNSDLISGTTKIEDLFN